MQVRMRETVYFEDLILPKDSQHSLDAQTVASLGDSVDILSYDDIDESEKENENETETEVKMKKNAKNKMVDNSPEDKNV
ncbi:MAG: hypothetical protein M3Q44_03980 [bacterium]|nr:hypothetical protein [bacterium]